MFRRLLLIIVMMSVIICGKGNLPCCAEEKIILASYAGEDTSLVYLAQELRYFAKNDLDVSIKGFEAGKLALEELLAGKADLATCSSYAFVSKSFNHPDLRIIAEICKTNHIELVARRDRGVKKISDIKGKRVGVSRKTAGEKFLGTFMLFNEISFNDIILVDLKPAEIVEAISKGDIDAGITWQPNVFNIKKRLGNNAISWPAQSGQDQFFVVAAKDGFIRRNPAAVKRLLRSLIKAEEFADKNNDKARELIRQQFNYQPEYINSVWRSFNFVLELSQALILGMEDEARWNIENKLTDKKEIPNYLDYIYKDALEKIAPERVKIIK